MPRDGSGTYTRAVSAYVNGTIASATTVNTEMDDIASALTGSLPVNGSKGMSAALDMGGFKVTGLAAGTNANDAIRYGQISTFSWTLMDDADAAAWRTTLGLGSVYQPLDGDLTAIAALGNGVPERTGTDTWSARTDVTRTSQNYTISGTWTFSTAPTFGTSGVCSTFGNGTGQARVDLNASSGSVGAGHYFARAGSFRWAVGLAIGDGTGDDWQFFSFSSSTIVARLGYSTGNWTISGTGTGVDWVSTSDRRLKDNIVPITDHWPLVEALAQSASRFDKAGRRHIGLIAQDFQEIAPELVLEGDDGYLAMPAGSPYAAILAKAVMDLTARIKALEARHA